MEVSGIGGCQKNSTLPDCIVHKQGRTDHLGTRALPEGQGTVGGPMRCPWYLS
ncbi:unnamed protein product [Staurois parvus]|uniref:Uncharacterized protein n=1 Tax=Staurois parvus TaxID=386267 RepID=A0ABN9BB95_9NEOB|nr:unnamed protein product [Staurois parvus]